MDVKQEVTNNSTEKKGFFSFNLQKIVMTLVFIFILPVYSYLFLVAGFFPPVINLFLLFSRELDILYFLLMCLNFVFGVGVLYLFSCIFVWIFSKINGNKKIQWYLIVGFLILLIILFFVFRFYAGGAIIGDSNSRLYNLLELYGSFFK